jgi:hypothetical protein
MSVRQKSPAHQIEHVAPVTQAATRKYDREKFVALANKRVTRAIKAIQLIGNLSNRSNYDYTDEDVVKILKALQHEIAACRKRFELASKKQGSIQFSLE